MTTSKLVHDVAVKIFRYLRRVREGATLQELRRACAPGYGTMTVRRALDVLRDEWDVPLGKRPWRLLDPTFTLPLVAPEPADVSLIRALRRALTGALPADLVARLRRMEEDLDALARASWAPGGGVRLDLRPLPRLTQEEPRPPR